MPLKSIALAEMDVDPGYPAPKKPGTVYPDAPFWYTKPFTKLPGFMANILVYNRLSAQGNWAVFYKIREQRLIDALLKQSTCFPGVDHTTKGYDFRMGNGTLYFGKGQKCTAIDYCVQKFMVQIFSIYEFKCPNNKRGHMGLSCAGVAVKHLYEADKKKTSKARWYMTGSFPDPLPIPGLVDIRRLQRNGSM